MAGMKGRSGGARPGAGRKPAQKPAPVPQDESDMLRLLQNIARGLTDATPVKKGDGGKKDEQAEKAKDAAAGRFGPAKPPLKIVANR